jgi:tRNA(Ile)-lysidine synthase
MAAVAGRLRRPLLGLDRATVRAAAEGLPVWDDPQNGDAAFARVRVRQAALPALEAALGPGISAALARTAALLRADTEALDDWALRVAAGVTGADGSLDAAALAELPVAVRSRVVRAAVLAAGSPAGDLRAEHVEAVEALVTSWHGQGPLELPGGVTVRRSCGRLLLARASADDGR